MFAPLLDGVRADIDRQIGWAKAEVRRQTRYRALIAVVAGVAALAALGAIVVGLIALYLWLAMQASPFAALGMIGSGLLLVALMLLVPAFVWRRPSRVASRPPLQTRPTAALLGVLGQASYDNAGREQALKLATGTVRHGSRSALLGTLVLAAVVGLIAGRRL
jgi:hypothetical protein